MSSFLFVRWGSRWGFQWDRAKTLSVTSAGWVFFHREKRYISRRRLSTIPYWDVSRFTRKRSSLIVMLILARFLVPFFGKNGDWCYYLGAGQTVSCSSNTTVLYNARCYYLDGSGGHCAPGYGRAPQATLAIIAQLFVNKTYYSLVSNNCCVWTSDPIRNYRMDDRACNAIGPFTRGPVIGTQGCSNATVPGARQLTFCGSL